MSNLNRLANVTNRYQGSFPRTLCVCSAGLLRSPTIAFVLSNPPFNHNTRAVGMDAEYALIPIDPVLVEWADEIVCANSDHVPAVKQLVDQSENPTKPIHCLDLPDIYKMRDPRLVTLITDKLKQIYKK